MPFFKKVFLLLIFSFSSFAQEIPAWKVTLKGFLVKIVSEETVDGWLDLPKKEEIRLPAIPKIIKKASSVESYERSAIDQQGKKYNELPADKRRQYEFNYLQELIGVSFKTTPKEEDLGKWMNVLDQGGSREGVYRAMVLGEEYYALENIEKHPSDKLITFSIQFSEKFLGKEWKKESLAKNNLFTVKRIITETGLEVLDELGKNPEDVYSWYAVMSVDLARDYSRLFTGKLRSSNTLSIHQSWAKTAPFQHIKSEFIIKLHSVMNSLED